MSMSLRDQLLQAGLVSQKQVKEAERQEQRHQQQRQHRQKPPQAPAKAQGTRGTPAVPTPAVPLPGRSNQASAQSAKAARDLELNRRRQEKAQRKALQAQIRQLIEQNRLPPAEGDEFYNFVDGDKIRRIGINAAIRGALDRGEVVIVRNQAGHAFVPAAIAARIHERDERAVIKPRSAPASAPVDEAYKEFAVPDDLMW